jgi:hypothetical protein
MRGKIDPGVNGDASVITDVRGVDMSAQSSQSAPQTGAQAVVADAVAHAAAAAAVAAPIDPARRPDVLFRVRREEGHEPSVWWMIGAFVIVSGAVISLLSFVPGGAG